jgi:hypothetical protein
MTKFPSLAPPPFLRLKQAPSSRFGTSVVIRGVSIKGLLHVSRKKASETLDVISESSRFVRVCEEEKEIEFWIAETREEKRSTAGALGTSDPYFPPFFSFFDPTLNFFSVP